MLVSTLVLGSEGKRLSMLMELVKSRVRGCQFVSMNGKGVDLLFLGGPQSSLSSVKSTAPATMMLYVHTYYYGRTQSLILYACDVLILPSTE